MNKSTVGPPLALPGYILLIFSIKSFFLAEYIILPPTGTMKFLSVEDIKASTLPFEMAVFTSLAIRVHCRP